MNLELARTYPKANLLALVVLIAVSIGLLLTRDPMFSGYDAALALIVIWVGLSPVILFLNTPAPRPAPFAALMGLFYLIFFGLPLFLVPLGWPGDTPRIFWPRPYFFEPLFIPEDVTRALELVAIGVVTLFLGFLSAARFLPRVGLYLKLHRAASTQHLVLLAWILLAAHFAFLLVPGLKSLPSVGQFFIPAVYAALGILVAAAPSYRWASLYGLTIVAAIALETWIRLEEKLLTDVALLYLFLGIILMRHQLRRALILAGAASFVFLSLYPFWIASRASSTGPVEVFQKSIALVQKTFQGEFRQSEEQSGPFAVYLNMPAAPYFLIVRRISHTWPFAYVVENSPAEIPHWEGYTYAPLLTSSVPRAIWPDKPQERTGYEFGTRYGFVLPEHTHMSFNLPWLTEAYVNFGKWGVPIVMVIIGLALGVMNRLLNDRRMTDIELAVGASIMFPLFYQESNLSVMVGSLPLFAAALLIYLFVGARILGHVRRPTAPSP